jgi:Flp pilus assembly protein TadG
VHHASEHGRVINVRHQPESSLTNCQRETSAAAGFARLKGEEASSLVEYAVIMTMLFMLLFGIAGFAEALYSYHFVAHAAREGTRWASLNGSTCAGDGSCGSPAAASDVQTYINNMVPAGIDGSKVTVNATWPSTAGVCATTDNAPGCPVEVQVSYQFNFNFPLIKVSQLTLQSSSEMTIAH